jgi:hypothetical protein
MTTPELVVSLEVAPSYRAGYPMPFAVTVGNPLPQRTYYALPEIDRFVVPPPLELVLVRVGEREGQLLPSRPPGAHEGEAQGMRMAGGESRRMLYDLAELAPALVAGPHELRARYLASPLSALADPVRFEVEIPEPDEAAAIARLRASNSAGAPSWNAFLLENFREIEPDELRDVPAAQLPRLALVLAMHRAIYGALGPARVPWSIFVGSGGGALDAELYAIAHELAVARSDPNTPGLQAQLLASWPALAWRVADNLAGAGLITRLRELAGADRAHPALPDPLPYLGAAP